MVPFVDRVEGAPICSNREDGAKAFEIYNYFFNSLGLYERKENVPPCEYYISTSKESNKYRANDNYSYTVVATLTFSTQVSAKDIFRNTL